MNNNLPAIDDKLSVTSTMATNPLIKVFSLLNTRTKILLGFSVPVALIAIISTVVYLSLGEVISTSKWVKHTQKVIADGKELEKLMIDMETGERGFLITGKDSFLEPFNQAQQVWDKKIKALEQLVIDNNEQVARVQSIAKLKEQWLVEAAEVEIKKRRQVEDLDISLDYMQTVLREGLGKSILDQIRTEIDQLTTHFKNAKNLHGQNLLITIAKDVVDQESGQRGFLITGEEEFLEPYHSGQDNLNLHMSQLRQLIDNNYDKNQVLAQVIELEENADQWLLKAAKPEIELRNLVSSGSKKFQDIEGKLIQATGKNILDKIRVKNYNLNIIFSKANHQQARNTLAKISKNLVDQETGQRGFLITGRPEFLQPFENAQMALKVLFKELRTQVKTNYNTLDVLPLLENIQFLSNKWREDAAIPEITARREINKTGLNTLEFLGRTLNRNIGKNLLDAQREIIDDLTAFFVKQNDIKGENFVLKLAKAIVDQETGERGFLITGEDRFLSPFKQGQQDFDNTLFDLMFYVGIRNSNSNSNSNSKNYQDLSDLRQDLTKLRTMQSSWLNDAANPEILARRQLDKNNRDSLYFIQKTLTRGTGKNILDEMRRLIDNLNMAFKDSNIQASNYLLTIAKAMADQETGQRGFLITGEESFLAPYISGNSTLRETFPKLKNIVSDSYEPKDILAKIAAVQDLTQTWLEQAALPELALRNKINSGEATYQQVEQVLSDGRGKGILDKIRYSFDTLKSILLQAQHDQAFYLILLLEKDIVDQETGQRGYLVTGRNEFLQPFEDGQQAMQRNFSQLKSIISASFDKKQVLNDIETLRLKSIEWENLAAAPEITLRRELNKTGAKMSDVTALIEQGTGKDLIDQIRMILKIFVETEMQLMLTREVDAENAAHNTVLIVLIGSIMAILIALLVSLLVSNSIVYKLALLVKATKRVMEGDYQQQINISSADEFGLLAQSFNNMTTKLSDNIEEMHQQNQRISASEEELREQSEELKASNEELEEKQHELTSSNEDLDQQRQVLEHQSNNLLSSKLMLEEKADQLALASKYKSEFLANMSHELRTPLNSLLILSKSLYENKQGNLTDDQVEEANIVYQGGRTLLTLINDIMDLSKVEAGMLNINIDTFLPGDVCDDIEALFRPIAQEKNLSFDIHIDQRLKHSIKTDKQRLEQILKNFLSNAFKFTEIGSVRLDIHPRSVDQSLLFTTGLVDEHLVCFSVTDSGVGIAEQKQRDIFEAFQQADGSTSRKYGGTGLGLTISKELAKLLGGEISMTSKPNSGSCFTLTLPILFQEVHEIDNNQAATNLVDKNLIKSPRPIQADASALMSSSITENAKITDWLEDDRYKLSNKDKTLLLIEDDKNFSQILIGLIHDLDLKVIATNKGRDGIMLALEYLPHGILLDLGLPDITGLKVLEQLKHNLLTRHIPVHVISASDNKMESLHMGALSYLQKPADPIIITSTLQEVYANSNAEIKRILVIEDDHGSQQAIKHLIAGQDTELSFANNAKEACELLMSPNFDCIILDLGLPDQSGTELVKVISEQPGAINVPIIIYTGQHITQDEYRILNQFTPSIVIKGAESPERLLDDVTLFLHHVGDKYSNKQQQTLQMLHDENAMLVGRRVLVVDDDMRNVFAITKILEQTGIKVIQAENGQVALDLLAEQEEPIELILMDVMMPVMDGLEAMGRIRQMEKYQSIPIIALTAKAMPGDRHQCIDAGASEYLTKPLDMDKVISMLRVWLYRRVVN